MAGRISTFCTTPRIVMGSGSVAGLGREVKTLGASRALLVTDPGIINAGLTKPVEDSLKAAEVEQAMFSEIMPDPRYEVVDSCMEQIKNEQFDCVIGLGGGSALDVAKSVGMMLGNQGNITDYCGVDLVPGPGVPCIAIPTTAGTGSEATPIAIFSDENEKLKKGVVSPFLFPKAALLDPELTVGMPCAITASTGMDSLIHAIEAYTSVNATDMTDMLAARAIKLISANLRTAYAQGGNIQARGAMLEGSLLAGMAFANAGVTAVHAFAYPIGAEFHIPHGVANTLMLPAVMEFNLMGNLAKFAKVAELMGQPVGRLSPKGAAERAVSAVIELTGDLNMPTRVSDFGVKDEHIQDLAAGVMKVTRLLANNPRTFTLKDAQAIYRQTL